MRNGQWDMEKRKWKRGNENGVITSPLFVTQEVLEKECCQLVCNVAYNASADRHDYLYLVTPRRCLY